jgi:[acyl-carrier-protein] S-malonyltransferase
VSGTLVPVALAAPRTAFVFPGLNGCANLAEHEPQLALPGFRDRWALVRAAFAGRPELDAFADALRTGSPLPESPAAWPLRALAVVALQLATADALEAAGVAADHVCGYSVGDVARSAFAGAFDFADVVAFAAALPALPRTAGATFALHAADAAACAAAAARCRAAGAAASELSPRFVLLGGSTVALTAARAACAGLPVRFTATGDCPLHSPRQRPLQRRLRAALANARLTAPHRATFSTLLGRALEPADDLRDELTANVAAPCDFAAAVRALHERHGVTHFVDLGPGRHAQRFVRHHELPVTAVAASELLAAHGAFSKSSVTVPARTRHGAAATIAAAPRCRTRAS